ncbi:hypothetical protein F5887DRAFT_916832 [Amanita rubescens]|nr:hypothetical protein F5887DRAFT_916832 [Amanita rubescens]
MCRRGGQGGNKGGLGCDGRDVVIQGIAGVVAAGCGRCRRVAGRDAEMMYGVDTCWKAGADVVWWAQQAPDGFRCDPASSNGYGVKAGHGARGVHVLQGGASGQAGMATDGARWDPIRLRMAVQRMQVAAGSSTVHVGVLECRSDAFGSNQRMYANENEPMGSSR